MLRIVFAIIAFSAILIGFKGQIPSPSEGVGPWGIHRSTYAYFGIGLIIGTIAATGGASKQEACREVGRQVDLAIKDKRSGCPLPLEVIIALRLQHSQFFSDDSPM